MMLSTRNESVERRVSTRERTSLAGSWFVFAVMVESVIYTISAENDFGGGCGSCRYLSSCDCC